MGETWHWGGGSLLDSHENMTGRWTEDVIPIASAKEFQLAMMTRKYAWCTQDRLLPSYCINEVKQKPYKLYKRPRFLSASVFFS